MLHFFNFFFQKFLLADVKWNSVVVFVLTQCLSGKGFKVHHTFVAEPITETQISWHM